MTNLTFDTDCLDLQYLEQPHACIEMLLNDGKGLTLGPDSDALLNFCDMPAPAQTDTQAGPDTPAAEDKGKAIAGASAEVPPFFPIPSTASVAHTVMDEDSKYSGAVPLLAVLARAMCTIFAVSTSVKGYHKKLQSLGSTDPGEVLLHRFAFVHISYQAESVLVPKTSATLGCRTSNEASGRQALTGCSQQAPCQGTLPLLGHPARFRPLPDASSCRHAQCSDALM